MKAEFKTTARADQVAAHLRGSVLNRMQPGTKLVSVRKLAVDLGVSVPTVRAAQAILTREGLLVVRHGSGVYAVENRDMPRWVGIYTALDILHPRTSSFYTLMPRALRRFFNSHGLHAEIYLGDAQPGDQEESPNNLRFRSDVAAGRIQGVVVANAPTTRGWANWVANLQIPVVGSLSPYRVDPSYDDMVRHAVQCLYDGGSRRIALLSWSHNELQKPLREALTGLSLEYHPEWSRSDLHPMLSGAGWEQFREIWAASRVKPDGLVVADDVLFDEAQIAIQEMGIRVPDQLRIVTYANKGSIKRYPFPVNIAQCDPERFAEVLGGMLLKRMRGEAVIPATELVPIDIVKMVQKNIPVHASGRSVGVMKPHKVGVKH